jgi:DNA polymerase-4
MKGAGLPEMPSVSSTFPSSVHWRTVWSPSSVSQIVSSGAIRKSVGAESTFWRDLMSLDDMTAELGSLVDKVWHYCDSTGVRGRTVTLKVKFADFQIVTRSRSRVAPISDRSTLASISAELLAAQFPMRKGVRLIGVSLSSLCADVDPQMALAL